MVTTHMSSGQKPSASVFRYMVAENNKKMEHYMSKQSTIDMIKVMQAYVDGKEVEYKGYDGWYKADIPTWDWADCEYRIKPQATKMTVAEINEQLGFEIEVVAG